MDEWTISIFIMNALIYWTNECMNELGVTHTYTMNRWMD